MGTLYENIIELCNDRGIKGGKMCTDIGMSKGILTDLKMGRQTGVSTANAQKIAAYFGVTVGYLLGEEENEKTATKNDSGMSEAKRQLLALAESCSDEEASRLLQMIELFLGRK